MGKRSSLTEAEYRLYAWDIREGKATREQALAVLEFFCQQNSEKDYVPRWLLAHLEECFQSFLSGERSIEAALGLKRGQAGRSRSIDNNPDRVHEIVKSLLESRLEGKSFEEAVAEVTERFNLGSTQVREMWREHNDIALILVRIGHERAKAPFTTDEIRRLRKIFPAEEWLARAGK